MNRLSLALFLALSCSTASAQSVHPLPNPEPESRVPVRLAQIGQPIIAQAQPSAGTPPATTPPPPLTPQQRMAQLRDWLQYSQKQIQAYEWIETTVISKDGEEKTRDTKRCYYDVNGQLQKVDIAHTADASKPAPGILPFGRLIDRVAAHRKEEITQYMRNAAALVHSYVPPDGGRIAQAVKSGRVSINLLQPGHLVGLDFRDYVKPGDLFSTQLELPSNRLVAINVTTYMDAPDQPINLNVSMGELPDGTLYPTRSVLNAQAQGVRIEVQNSGHRRVQQ